MMPYSSPLYTAADKRAFLSQLKPGIPGVDPQGIVRQFEAAIADKIEVPKEWVMATNSATAALAVWFHTSIGGLVVESPILTWPSTYACAPRYSLVDVTNEGWPLWSDRKDVARVGVELWGRNFPLYDYEDGCQGGIVLDASHNALLWRHGDLLRKKQVRAVVYSFGAIKQLSCVRGGALISPEITPQIRAFTDSGTVGKDAMVGAGFNFEMGEPNAALGLSQLKRFAANQRHLFELLEKYRAALPNIHGNSGHLAVLECRSEVSRLKVVGTLLKAGIAVGHHYPLPAHLPQALFPGAMDLSRRVLTLPLHMSVTEVQVDQICEIVLEVM